jgi:hypothetical protein
MGEHPYDEPGESLVRDLFSLPIKIILDRFDSFKYLTPERIHPNPTSAATSAMNRIAGDWSRTMR